MDVKILGTGCAKCMLLYEETGKAIKRLGLAATFTKVEKISEIAAFKVLRTPALVINGVVKAAGRMPSTTELTTWLATAAASK